MRLEKISDIVRGPIKDPIKAKQTLREWAKEIHNNGYAEIFAGRKLTAAKKTELSRKCMSFKNTVDRINEKYYTIDDEEDTEYIIIAGHWNDTDGTIANMYLRISIPSFDEYPAHVAEFDNYYERSTELVMDLNILGFTYIPLEEFINNLKNPPTSVKNTKSISKTSTKITTADCKNAIVNYVKANIPSIQQGYAVPIDLLPATLPRNWSRREKLTENGIVQRYFDCRPYDDTLRGYTTDDGNTILSVEVCVE